MRKITLAIGLFLCITEFCKAQNNENTNATSNKTEIVPQVAANAINDSIAKDKINGTIYTKVAADGVIEITKSEFNKIAEDRKEGMKKDKNYRIIEDTPQQKK